ncbi:MAG: hypothetical protein E6R03_02680 [Hyphomicrobiaceae bacterium]|nr:MAG: hypothetical protein E6R03_02680 [Hyphomicrobiaceae bacterium]
MKMGQDAVDLALSQYLAAQVNPTHAMCYWNSLMAAQYLGEGSSYCEGWIITTAPVEGALVFVLAAHGWAEKGGKIVDVEGAAHCYFESSRRPGEGLSLPDVPLHSFDRQATKRHQRQMKSALDHLLGLSPAWSAITVHGAKVPTG